MKIPVVIVDDEEVDRYIAIRAIKASGADCNVVQYRAGDEFVDTCADTDMFKQEVGDVPPPALVLLDINMPRMDGFEVLEKLKQQFLQEDGENRCVIVMMYSSSNHAEDRSDAFAYDFVKDYVVKPLDATGFKALIEKHYEAELVD